MTDPIRLRVIGTPSPQGSKTAYTNGGKTVVVEGKSQTGRRAVKEWRRAVADAARAHLTRTGTEPVDWPCQVTAVFAMARPKSVSVKARPFPSVKPDIDKLARSTLDALGDGGLLPYDQQVVDLHVRKIYAAAGEPPGAVIVIRPHGGAS